VSGAANDGVNDATLAAYQTAFSELLALDLPADEKARRLATEAAFDPYRAYVTTFDLRLIETLSALCRVHARRRGVEPRV
jgi:hypothetical protein